MKVESYYITQGAFKGIINKLDIKFNDITVELCQKYYESEHLRSLLTNKDIEFLYLTKVLFGELNDEFLIKAERKQANSDFMLDNTSAPKYHISRECKAMSNNYINFLIPPEIKARGEQEIKRCKEFAHANRHLLREDEPRFIQKLEITFMLKNPPKKLEYSNSGIRELSSKTLEELKEIIDVSINKAVELMQHNKLVYNNRYKPRANPETDAEDLKLWLNQIKPTLMSALFSFGVKKYGNGEIRLEKSLLERFNFEPCRVCCK